MTSVCVPATLPGSSFWEDFAVANLPSSRKRDRQNDRNRERNQIRRSRLKTETRKFLDAVQKGDVDGAKGLFVTLTKHIDQVAAKSTLHKNTAARRKSRLARRLNEMSGKA